MAKIPLYRHKMIIRLGVAILYRPGGIIFPSMWKYNRWDD